MTGQGTSMVDAIRSIGVTEVTYYRWRSEYGGMKLDQVKRLKGAGGRECPAAQGGVGSDAGQADPEGSGAGKLLSPSRRRQCVDHSQRELQVSERRACAALGQHRSTQRKAPRGRSDEACLTADIIALARAYGR
jgi:putative transposase